jgi:geranylgeranyl diphosphate synthase type II
MTIQQEFDILTADALVRIEDELERLLPAEPQSLYDPLRYINEAGGKRLRPLLTYLAGKYHAETNWLGAACAVELLHTFTLIHDDIMDNANIRRGKRTLHKKYDLNTAILGGDVLIALALESLTRAGYAQIQIMLDEFAKGFRYVCEGQALDKEYENSLTVSLDGYIRMIDYKSAKMLELSAVLGSYAAGGQYTEELREFAHNVGIAFQIRDDLLDLTADEASFGKTKGGDILEGKRTYMFVKAMDMFTDLTETEQLLLRKIQGGNARLGDIAKVEALFNERGILSDARTEIEIYTRKGQEALAPIADSSFKDGLMLFSNYLIGRDI